ncbi:MAG: lipopolysaccharide biosynthesis protein [Planctomyces sp.]|jgi:O-antigen/teichoic acid export membrane protein
MSETASVPPPTGATRSIASDALGTMVIRAAGIALLFASTTATAVLLGPTEYGEFSAALSLALLFATAAPLGTDRVLVRRLSISGREAAGSEVSLTHRCSLWPALVIACGSLLTAAACSAMGYSAWSRTLTLAVLMALPLTLTYLRQWTAIPLVGTRSAILPEQFLIPLLSLLLLGLLWLLRLPLAAVPAAIGTAVLTLGVWLVTVSTGRLGAVYRDAWQAAAFERGAVRHRTREGLPFVLVATGVLLAQRCLPVAVAAGAGFAASAQFSWALMAAGIASLPLGILNLSLMPGFARMHHHGDLAGAQLLARHAATLTFSAAATAAVVLLAGTPLLHELLGDGYADVPRMLLPLLLAVLVDCLTGPTIPVMQTTGLERLYGRCLALHLPLQLLLVFGLSRLSGAMGAAVAYLIGRVLWNAAVFLLIRRYRSLIMLPSLGCAAAEFRRLLRWGHRSIRL